MNEEAPGPINRPSKTTIALSIGKVGAAIATIAYVAVWSGLFTPPAFGFGVIVDVIILSMLISAGLFVLAVVGTIWLASKILSQIDDGVETDA